MGQLPTNRTNSTTKKRLPSPKKSLNTQLAQGDKKKGRIHQKNSQSVIIPKIDTKQVDTATTDIDTRTFDRSAMDPERRSLAEKLQRMTDK